MRRDKVIFDGSNPFNSFANCKELTVFLGADRFIFVGSINSISIVRVFPSRVTFVDEDEKIPERFTVPLSLMLPIFRIDDKEKGNSLTLETSVDGVHINYNDVSVTSKLFSANGATVRLLDSLNIADSMEINPNVFVSMTDAFGMAKDNFCNVDNNSLYISDHRKCLIRTLEFSFKRKFSLSVQFVKMMKSMKCNRMYIGNNAVAITEDGTFLVQNLTKLQNEQAVMDYKFAKMLKPKATFEVKLNKYMKHINAAANSAELGLSLDLARHSINITSVSGEQSIIELDSHEYDMSLLDSFDTGIDKFLKQASIRDQHIIKMLAAFKSVLIKVCGTMFLVELDKQSTLMFVMERDAS
jgi:hypothetical protein